jgi:uncharacterized membrane protein
MHTCNLLLVIYWSAKVVSQVNWLAITKLVFVIYHHTKERMNNEIELSRRRNITFKTKFLKKSCISETWDGPPSSWLVDSYCLLVRVI